MCPHKDCVIRLDYANMMSSSIGDQGFTPQIITSSKKVCLTAHHHLKEMRDRGRLPWMDLPHKLDNLHDILAFRTRVEGSYDTLIVLGIGGCSRGNLALHTALTHPFFDLLPKRTRGNRMRLFVCDNTDPERFMGLLSIIDPKKTLFNVISKSGSTEETLAQFLIVHDLLKTKVGPAALKKQLIITTDAKHGALRKLAQSEGYTSFSIPEGTESRYSVFSPVGLLSAALEGIDIEMLLDGARRMDAHLQEPDIMKNPAYLSALFQFLADTRQGRNILVMMPYAERLRGLTEWYRQLWAESLGKKQTRDGQIVHCGSTPIAAVGSSDQHSQLQLFVEGPQDKVIVFIGVESFHTSGEIPRAKKAVLTEFGHLGGSNLEKLLQNERLATTLTLHKARRPNMTFLVPDINPCTVGQLLFLFQVQTVFAAELYNVNAFDQPGAELGKETVHALMGRKGYEKQHSDFEKELGNPDNSCIC